MWLERWKFETSTRCWESVLKSEKDQSDLSLKANQSEANYSLITTKQIVLAHLSIIKAETQPQDKNLNQY